jgi:hypothetical protein
VALLTPSFFRDQPAVDAILRFSTRRWVRWTFAVALFGVAFGSVAHSATGGSDFRLNVWYPGRALFQGRDPYDIASFERYYGVHVREAFSNGWFPLYGPVHLWLAAFFALFPASLASALWFVLNICGLGIIALVVARVLDRRLGGPAFLAIAGLLVLTRPGRANLEIGQAAIVYTLFTYVAWSQVRRRPWLSAVALALALGKPPFGLPLLALFLAMGVWRVVVRGLLLFVVVSAPMVAWLSVNAGSPAALFHAVVHNLRYTDQNPLDATGSAGRIDALSLAARYSHGSFGGGFEVGAFAVVISVAAFFILRAGHRDWSLSPAVLMLLGLATVLSVAHQYYDLLVLAWPFAAVLRDPLVRPVDRVVSVGKVDTVRGRADDRPAPLERVGWPVMVMLICTIPALVATVVPSNVTVKVLGLGSGTAIISTVTTVALLLAMAGAIVGITFGPPSRVSRGGSQDDEGEGPDSLVPVGRGARAAESDSLLMS